MSRGPGRIERAIEAVLDGEPDNAFTTDDLCRRVYPGINRIEKKHRVAVTRAAGNVAKRRETLRCRQSKGLGGTLVWFDCDRVMAYAMGRLKTDYFANYQSNDLRIPDHCKRTDKDLRAKLAPGADHHKYVVPGGAWWNHADSWRREFEAKRAGDDERLQAIYAEREAENQMVNRALGIIGSAIKANR